ncbi:MAG TPA: hypothetical protein PLW66_14175, partial [Saprospiraceae bacterium]|nr:hypothetical protein [Saprospiraceae bacterium]
AQLYLSDLLQLVDFQRIRFLHHPLILGASGEKLSKSAGAASLRALRESGAGPAFVYGRVARLLELPAPSYSDSASLLDDVRRLVCRH